MLIMLTTLVIVLPQSAIAEHEIFHRFTVAGKVVDPSGNPAACVDVIVTDVNNGVSRSGETDSSGQYRVTLQE